MIKQAVISQSRRCNTCGKRMELAVRKPQRCIWRCTAGCKTSQIPSRKELQALLKHCPERAARSTEPGGLTAGARHLPEVQCRRCRGTLSFAAHRLGQPPPEGAQAWSFRWTCTCASDSRSRRRCEGSYQPVNADETVTCRVCRKTFKAMVRFDGTPVVQAHYFVESPGFNK